MAASPNQPARRGLFSGRRRGQAWVELSGYRVGDIQLDEPVFVLPKAHIVGNIIAPRLRVGGFVYGSTAALETTLLEQGQIWGDVYSGHLEVAAGGRVQGWVSALTEPAYQAIREAGVVPAIDPNGAGVDLPADGRSVARSDAQISLLRKLQVEAAAALAARVELEQTFDRRLQEVAGDTAARLAATAARLEQAEQRSAELESELDAQRLQLQQRAEQLARQGNELTVTRQMLDDRSAELAALQQALDEQLSAGDRLQAARTQLETDLRQARGDVDRLTDRVTALDTALRANVQHSAEQEDALLRWQELAEATQARATELENELQALRALLDEAAQVGDQAQQKLEAEWLSTSAQLQAYQRQKTEPLGKMPAETAELIARIAELEADLALAQEQAAPPLAAPAAPDTAAAALEAQVAALEELAQERQEQLLWSKASLETNRTELDRLRAQLAAQESQLAALQAGTRRQTAVAEQWTAETTALRAQIGARDEAIGRLEQALDAAHQEAQRAQQAVAADRQQLQAQLTTLEADLAQYEAQTSRQGQQLAEARALLIERDEAVDKALAQLAAQTDTLNEFKQAAGKRIKKLHVELAQAQKQLADVTQALERARGRG